MPTVAENPALFPADIRQHSMTFEVDEAQDLALAYPGIALPDSLGRAVRKRQAEFLAGRFCAREALRSVVPDEAERPILVGVNREPLWPTGIVGSITHTILERHGRLGFVSVAVARKSNVRAIGLDAERMMDLDLAERVIETIATRAEVDGLVKATGWPLAPVLTVLFSAKETLFKCLYPEVGSYFDFRDATLRAIDPEGRFSIALERTLTPALPAGATFEGRFERKEASVCTAMVLHP